MRTLLILFISVFVLNAQAKSKPPSEPPLRKGWAVTVVKLDKMKRLLHIQIDATPGIGPNCAKPEALAKAINFAEPAEKQKFIDDPIRFVGSSFVLEKDLELVPNPY